jgi:hypothetical protein
MEQRVNKATNKDANGNYIASSKYKEYYVEFEYDGLVYKSTDAYSNANNLKDDGTFKTDNYNRSNGLIALSQKGIKELQDWSEGDVIINLDDDTVENTVFGWYENIEEYNEEQREWDDDFEDCTLDDIEEISHNIGNFDVEEIDDIIEEIYNIGDVCRFGSEIFEMIE